MNGNPSRQPGKQHTGPQSPKPRLLTTHDSVTSPHPQQSHTCRTAHRSIKTTRAFSKRSAVLRTLESLEQLAPMAPVREHGPVGHFPPKRRFVQSFDRKGCQSASQSTEAPKPSKPVRQIANEDQPKQGEGISVNRRCPTPTPRKESESRIALRPKDPAPKRGPAIGYHRSSVESIDSHAP
jgi:hypothetical protein